jgi:hypothetical protein
MWGNMINTCFIVVVLIGVARKCELLTRYVKSAYSACCPCTLFRGSCVLIARDCYQTLHTKLMDLRVNRVKFTCNYVPPGLPLKNSVVCPQCIYMFCVDLRTNSDYFTVQH